MAGKRTAEHSEKSDRSEKQQKLGTKSEEWTALLKSTTLQSLLKDKKDLIAVRDNMRLKQVMEILQKEQILSVPVVDERERFVGFVDVIDIAGYALAEWRRLSVHLDRLHFPANHLFQTEVAEVLNYSSTNTPVLIGEEQSLAEAIEIFKSPSTFNRLHRIGVVSHKKLVNVISQSDIVAFAAKHLPLLEEPDRVLSSMPGLIRSPIMVTLQTPFAEALDTLFRNRVSGLALVDHEFKLSGNLSASDLRGMNSLGFDFFTGSTLQFLVKGTKSKMKPTQSVTLDTTFGEAIKLLAEEKLHRLYIIAPSGFPQGFISLIDVIARLH